MSTPMSSPFQGAEQAHGGYYYDPDDTHGFLVMLLEAPSPGFQREGGVFAKSLDIAHLEACSFAGPHDVLDGKDLGVGKDVTIRERTEACPAVACTDAFIEQDSARIEKLHHLLVVGCQSVLPDVFDHTDADDFVVHSLAMDITEIADFDPAAA